MSSEKAERAKKSFRESQWAGKDQFAQTPTEVMLELVKEFGLLNDVCPRNPQRNGLEETWQEVNYMNPPYAEINEWLAKAVSEWKMKKTVVALLPVRSGTNWFHDYCLKYCSEIRFIRQGIRFKGYRKKSPFPVGLFIFRAEDAENLEEESEEEVNVKITSVDFYEKEKIEKENRRKKRKKN